MIASVKAPSNAVEFEMNSLDLAVRVQAEEIEAFDFILSRADAIEDPLPQNLCATSDENLDSGDTFYRWRVEDAVDVHVFSLKCGLAKLETCQPSTNSGIRDTHRQALQRQNRVGDFLVVVSK